MPGKQARLAAEARRVVRLVADQRVLHFAVVDRRGGDVGRERQRPADEIGHALADHRADDILRQRRVAELREQRVHRRREIVDRVEQRAVEVEGDGADVDAAERRAASLGAHRTAASSARIRAIVAVIVRRAEDRRPRDERVGAGLRGRRDVVDLDAAVDLEQDPAAGPLLRSLDPRAREPRAWRAPRG